MRRNERVYRKVRAAVFRRSHGACEKCGVGIPDDAFECHHRQMRSQGGQDEFVNCVALCGQYGKCHREIHANPERSYREGWLVKSHQEPSEVPVFRWGGWERLCPTGWQTAKTPARA